VAHIVFCLMCLGGRGEYFFPWDGNDQLPAVSSFTMHGAIPSFLIRRHGVLHSQSFLGGQLYSAFVVLLNIKHSLCILTDCVALSLSSAMKSYHFDPQRVTEIWCL